MIESLEIKRMERLMEEKKTDKLGNKSKINTIPLIEGHPSDNAVINPKDWFKTLKKLRGVDFPELPRYGILSFQYMNLSKTIEEKYNGEKLIIFSDHYAPLYLFSWKSLEAVFASIPVGSATAGMKFEELISLGLKTVILVGGVGVLYSEIPRGTFIIPEKALRDEGTSFHYQLPSRYSFPSEKITQSIRETLRSSRIGFTEGATWTTDAPYRETHDKVRRYRAEGVITVDMEASALFSIARFRGIDIGALFIAGDCVGGKKWDDRRERRDQNQVQSNWNQALDLAINTLWQYSLDLQL